jgi:hypothetical protein
MLTVMDNKHLVDDATLIALAERVRPTIEEAQGNFTPIRKEWGGEVLLLENEQVRYRLLGGEVVMELHSPVTMDWSTLHSIDFIL